MNSRALRRLAADHAALHNELPPNYLFPPDQAADDLTSLDVLLAGPTHTPFAAGVWKLHLNIPPTYPQQPPTAHFRTPIFHPNVDPQTGGVCVETLKRDWNSSYTLGHVLQTISCLLIQPNPDSALNAEAGALIQESYDAYARRAELMTSISAAVPAAMRVAVEEAQSRGHEQSDEIAVAVEAPARRRRTIAQARARAAAAAHSSPPPAPGRRVQQMRSHPPPPFVFQAGLDDVFAAPMALGKHDEEDEEFTVMSDGENMEDADQENDQLRSPPKDTPPSRTFTPRRPRGTAVPLGELIIDDPDSSSDMEPEYPPSPRKSPSKSPSKFRGQPFPSLWSVDRAESSREAILRARNTTPPNVTDKPLAEDSPFSANISRSPHRPRADLFGVSNAATQPSGRNLFDLPTTADDHSIFGRLQQSTGPDRELEERLKRRAQDARLWDLCGRNVKRWNCGDFDGAPIRMKASRW